jgi:uncharacterized protein (TIGR02453 family)
VGTLRAENGHQSVGVALPDGLEFVGEGSVQTTPDGTDRKMMNGFAGFPEEGLRFLDDLGDNNNKEWFHSRKETYERTVREPMTDLVRSLNEQLVKMASAYTVGDPNKAVSRIFRDTRFSADKSPYHTRLSAIFPCGGGAKTEVAGFFVGVSAAGVDVLGGAYMPGSLQLKCLRAAIAADHETFTHVIGARAIRDLMGRLQGEQLQRVPRDYPADHPAADLLRNKQFYFRTTLDPALATTPQLLPEVVRRLKAMTPFVQLLDAVLAT